MAKNGSDKDDRGQDLECNDQADAPLSLLCAKRTKDEFRPFCRISDKPVHYFSHENEKSCYKVEFQQADQYLDANDCLDPVLGNHYQASSPFREETEKDDLQKNPNREHPQWKGNPSKALAYPFSF